MIKVPPLVMPEPEANGFIRTLNNMGYMTSDLDRYSAEWARFSVSAPGPALEIGAAYGNASLEAPRLGANVVANDIEEKHLQILRDRTPTEARARLRTLAGSFPNGIEFQNESLGSILICRVLHFFDGETLLVAAKQIFDWLAIGGKAFIVTETPYLKNFSNFIPVFEKRKSEGNEWPGFITDVAAIDPVRAKHLPRQMHLFDADTLSSVFYGTGFVIEEAKMFARPEFPEDLRLDGRESVGLIFRKPKSLDVIEWK